MSDCVNAEIFQNWALKNDWIKVLSIKKTDKTILEHWIAPNGCYTISIIFNGEASLQPYR
jgi:hypothetical protein